MSFHPFKFKYSAEILEEKEGNTLLKLRLGSTERMLYFPSGLLPQELSLGDHFTLTIQPEQSAREDEALTMKKLLEDLIH